MLDPDTRAYLDISLGSIKDAVSRLTEAVNSQAGLIRNIELQTTTRIAEIQKDINNLYEEIEVLKEVYKKETFTIEKEEGARQAADISIIGRFEKAEEEQRKKWDVQDKINSKMNALFWILSAAIMVWIGLLATDLYNLWKGLP